MELEGVSDQASLQTDVSGRVRPGPNTCRPTTRLPGFEQICKTPSDCGWCSLVGRVAPDSVAIHSRAPGVLRRQPLAEPTN